MQVCTEQSCYVKAPSLISGLNLPTLPSKGDSAAKNPRTTTVGRSQKRMNAILGTSIGRSNLRLVLGYCGCGGCVSKRTFKRFVQTFFKAGWGILGVVVRSYLPPF